MHLHILALALAAAASPIAANSSKPPCTPPSVNLYVSSDGDGLHTLQYKQNQLTNVSWTGDCGTNAVWLELDKKNKLLYCLAETQGLATSFKIADDGKLSKSVQAAVQWGPVSSILFNAEGDNRAIALAHFGNGTNNNSGVSTLSANPDGSLELIEYLAIEGIGSNVTAGRQTAPHPHQVLLDPTGAFIVTPDLGSDLIRLYSFDKSNNKLTALESVPTTPGSGPRHGIFWSPSGMPYKPDSALYYIAVHELDNSVVVWKVTYPDGKITFEKKQSTNTFNGAPPPPEALASEIQISPDNKYLYAANRLDASYSSFNPDPANATMIPSDSIIVFRLKDGEEPLEFSGRFAIGGINPRHFSINKAGTLLAVGLLKDNIARLLKRDPRTGDIGDPVATLNMTRPSTLIFDE